MTTMRASFCRTSSAAALGALLVAGCAVGPRFSPPKPDVPASWTGVGSGGAASVIDPNTPSQARWWASFNDAELSSLVERADASNLDVRQAVLRIDEARAQRRLAAGGAWPQIDAVASYSNTRISERTATTSLLSALGGAGKGGAPGGVAAALPGLTNPFNQYQYGLTAAWELDLFGRVRRSVEAADADTQAAVQDARAVRVSLMAEVASAYIDLRTAQAQLRIAQDSLQTVRGLSRLAQDARGAGLGDDLDIAQAKSVVSTAESQIPPLDQRITADKNQLALLLAAKPGALDAELDIAGAVPPPPPVVPIGLPSELARRRPDIQRAEAQLHAAVARQGVAVANLYPSVSLTASPGFEAARPAALTSWAASYLAYGPSLDLPIFDGGQRRASVHLQDVRAKEAALVYAKTVLGALDEVEDAVDALDQEQTRRGALLAAQAESGKALTLAERRYQAGSVSFHDVLDAQAKVQQAQSALTQSTGVTAADVVGLYKALGGGWEAGASNGG
jgi:multidrug efflux system outer membrane protein